jgi:RNA polymerase sigma-70 factor (ECF subfamily)
MFKDKSPYTLRTEVVDGIARYYVSFVDGEKVRRETEVSLPVYEAFLSFVRVERNMRRWDERHRERSEFIEDTLYTLEMKIAKTVEEIVFDLLRYKSILLATQQLTKVQQRRFFLYHAFGFTYEQIAEIEGCTAQVCHKSVARATKKIKKM